MSCPKGAMSGDCSGMPFSKISNGHGETSGDLAVLRWWFNNVSIRGNVMLDWDPAVCTTTVFQ